MDLDIQSKTIHGWIIDMINDPLSKILLKNSHLTKIQFETLLIDILAEEIVEKKLSYEEKAKMRLLNGGVSRGAFNRTLNQARKNMIKSIYTVLLLGYIGILETNNLNSFIEISHELQAYIKSYKNVWKGLKSNSLDKKRVNSLVNLRKRLELRLITLFSRSENRGVT